MSLLSTLAALVVAAPPPAAPPPAGPSGAPPNAALIDALPDCKDESCPAFVALRDRGPAIWPDLKPIIAPPADARRPPDELTRFWSIGLCATLRLEACAPHLERILTVGAEVRLRAASAFALADIRGAAASPQLRLACTDTDANVRFEAASALGRLRGADPETFRTLVELLSDRDADVRLAAIEALGLGSHEGVGPHLVHRLKHDTRAMNRGFAAISLGQRGIRDAAPDLIARLTAEPDPEALAAAAWALGELMDANAIKPLEALEGHADARVREAAAAALKELREVPPRPPRPMPKEGPARHPVPKR
jgi:hypothetical protein